MPNRLAQETSPYLLQHAHNPVDWYPWGPEALERARIEDKPILVSIGYSACHWCHVMERESFEDPEVAALMNRLFVNIKIDREERPDLDQIYMSAVQVMTGSGGWPLNVFLTPDALPFTGGTYFPPKDLPGRPAWPTVLRRVHDTFSHHRNKVNEQAVLLLEHLRTLDTRFTGELPAPGGDDRFFPQDLTDRIFASHLQQADAHHGGFGGAPKFPGTMGLRFLLRHGHFNHSEEATRHALFSLECMAAGGIFDQIGGGFARYATDSHWLVPHFEKMLYDNALLVSAYAEGFQVEARPRFAQTVRETFGFVLRELTDSSGGFYAALDADSEGVEGKFYTWDQEEIQGLLGEKADRFCRYYGVRPHGNWEEVNILHRTINEKEFAEQEKLTEAAWEAERQESCRKLLSHREGRVRPGLDNKVILGWNALMVSGLYRAHAALDGVEEGASAWKAAADRCLDFLGTEMREGNSLLRVWQRGRARFDAVLDDYAGYIAALLDGYEAGWDERRLREAMFWTASVLERFSDEQDRYFYYTPVGKQDVVIRSIDHYDGATPSGNAVMAENLLRLGLLAGRPDWTARGRSMLAAMAETTAKYGTSFGAWACAIAQEVAGRREIAITGPAHLEFGRVLRRRFSPGTLYMAAAEPDRESEWPLLEHRGEAGRTLIYVCRNYTCEKPVEHPDQVIG